MCYAKGWTYPPSMLSTSSSMVSDWEVLSEFGATPVKPPGPKPLPPLANTNSLQQPQLKYGGLPLPRFRATPKSLQFSHGTDVAMADQSTGTCGTQAKDLMRPSQPKRLRMSAPSSQQASSANDALTPVKQPSQCLLVQKLWDELVSVFMPYSRLMHDIENSVHRAHHVARILDNFAATTLSKYIPAITNFVEACHSLHLSLVSLTAVQMADGLIAVRLARSSDGILMNSATVIKALRWSVKQLGADCFQCAFDGLISKFLSDKIPRDIRESLPLPLHCFLHWKRKILMSSTNPLLIIILGSFLLQAWTGLRWADMQRVSPINLIFDFETLRGIAWRTKTTTKGQAFGCTFSGFLSHGTHNWLLVYLRALDKIYGQHGDPNLNYIVPRITGEWNQLQLVQPLKPMRYADALYYLRVVIPTPWKQNPFAFEVQNYTIHGLKATLLSWCSPRLQRKCADNRGITNPSMHQFVCTAGTMCTLNCSSNQCWFVK